MRSMRLCRTRWEHEYSHKLPSLLLVVAVASFAAHRAYSFAPNGRFVLDGPSAKSIFHQCSRAAPPANSGLWEPSGKDLDELEASLAKYLNEGGKAGKLVLRRAPSMIASTWSSLEMESAVFTAISIPPVRSSCNRKPASQFRSAMAAMSSGELCIVSKPRLSKSPDQWLCMSSFAGS